MSKEAQVSEQVRDLFNKMAWLNKSRMEEQLKGYKSSEVHCIEAIKKAGSKCNDFSRSTLYDTWCSESAYKKIS